MQGRPPGARRARLAGDSWERGRARPAGGTRVTGGSATLQAAGECINA
jgi:hypothetical protein